jgi:hypothetical protein
MSIQFQINVDRMFKVDQNKIEIAENLAKYISNQRNSKF